MKRKKKTGDDMKAKLMSVLRILVSFLLSFMLLSVFVYLYSFSGVHVTNRTHATDYTWEPNQWKANMEEGFSWLSMDSNGFNNAEPISTDIDVLMMGSSHMQAVNVPPDRNTVYLLNQALPDLYFYNIGVAGHEIYNVVNNIGDAIETFKPKQYIIIETSIVNLDEETMQQVISGDFVRIRSYDSGVIYHIQKNIPLVKSLYKAVEDWRSSSKHINEPTVSLSTNPDSYYATLRDFLGIAKTACGNQVKLIICYQPATELGNDGSMICVTNPDSLSLFSRACEENEIIFVDMTEDFQESYQSRSILPHGFTNTAIGAGHLNEAGHEMIAERLAITIQEQEAKEN